jgi:hypothetical protein
LAVAKKVRAVVEEEMVEEVAEVAVVLSQVQEQPSRWFLVQVGGGRST